MGPNTITISSISHQAQQLFAQIMVLLVRVGLGLSWERYFSSNQLCSFGLGLFLGEYDQLSNGLETAMSWSLCGSRKPITSFSGHHKIKLPYPYIQKSLHLFLFSNIIQDQLTGHDTLSNT
jgi:hypothetical protein